MGKFDSELLETLPDLVKMVDKESNSRKGRVNIYIDSPGGRVHVLKSFLMVMEEAKLRDVIVATFVMGRAASAGSLLAVAGTPGFRQMYRHGEHYLHYGSGGTYVTNPEEVERSSAYMRATFQWAFDHYMANGDFSEKALDNLMKDEYGVLGAEEALEYGIVDLIVGG